MDFTHRISKQVTGLTLEELAAAVTDAGYTIGREGVRQWRTGVTKPGTHEAVTALEQALDITDGSLRDALGLRGPVSLEERVAKLERQVDALRRGRADLMLEDAISEVVGRDRQTDVG